MSPAGVLIRRMVRTGFCCPGRLFPEGRGNRFGSLPHFLCPAGSDLIRHSPDIPCPGQGPLGQARPHQFIDQHGEKDDIPDQRAIGAAQHPAGCGAHTQGHAGLGQQRDAQVLPDRFRTVDHGGGQACAQVFTQRPGDNVYHAGQEYGRIAEDLKLQRRAAENKEQSNGRAGPAVRLQHQVPSCRPAGRKTRR